MTDTIGRKYKYEGNHISILIPKAKLHGQYSGFQWTLGI